MQKNYAMSDINSIPKGFHLGGHGVGAEGKSRKPHTMVFRATSSTFSASQSHDIGYAIANQTVN